MIGKSSAITLAALLLAGTSTAVLADSFKRIASFSTHLNLPADMDRKTITSAEIIAATPDGNTVVYSDSPLEALGIIDISDPASPKPKGIVALDGEPTSVAIAGNYAVVGVNTSASYVTPSGYIAAFDLASGAEVVRCDLGGQPDSVALSKDGSMVAVAIENERDEDLGDGGLPQMPAGTVAMLAMDGNAPACGSLKFIELTGLAVEGGSDPEPEFVDFNMAGHLAVTMQENNHIAIIDSATGEVVAHFSAGAVDLYNVDLDEERALTFDGIQLDRPREPDAVKWLDDNRLVIANEGDYKGGSRGFTIFNRAGDVLYESGLDFEYRVAMAGHYPERRSGNKGVEPEGLEVSTYNGETYIFVLAERSGIVGVYRDTGAAPEFIQLLPTGIGPESAVAIPSRNLLVVANEEDLIEDGGIRSQVMIYQLGEGEPQYPHIMSTMENGRPIGWGALSGLTADPTAPGILYAVNDSFYAMQPSIFTIDASSKPARIIKATPVTRAGYPAQMLDLEGVVSDGNGGFWLASEGRTDRLIPHALYHVDGSGEIQTQVPFPPELLAVEKRFGSEGITLIGDTLWIAIQRSWSDDPKNTVKLVSYNIETKEWGAVRYPTAAPEKGWVGLSEITAHGDYVYIVERDNQIGSEAVTKKLYRVALSQMKPAALGGDLPMVTKEEVHDFIPDLLSTGGYVVDKIEGFAIDVTGTAYAVTDNDGVDDSNGETYFFSIGNIGG